MENENFRYQHAINLQLEESREHASAIVQRVVSRRCCDSKACESGVMETLNS
jgi:hypothetical protein